MAERDPNAWMVTFSDLVTLLITFFVLLLTMSTLDTNKLKEMFKYFPGSSMALIGGEPGINEPEKVLVQNINLASRVGQIRFLDSYHSESFHALSSKLKNLKLKEKLKIVHKEDSFEIHLDSDAVFDRASLKIRKDALKAIKEISNTLKEQPGVRLRIESVAVDDKELEEIEGIDSLWDLAIQRGGVVVETMSAKFKTDDKRLSMMGFGIDRPVVSGDNTSYDQRVEFVFLENEDPIELNNHKNRK